MVELDLNQLNAAAPYRVVAGKMPLTYYFETESSILFKIEFAPEDLLPGVDMYQLSIINAEHKSSPRDRKLRQTIIAIIHAFFKASNTALLYICETGDGKQELRDRLFRYWFVSDMASNGFTMSSSVIKDEEGIDNYATIILRNDHPQLGSIVAEFTATAELLNNKPS